MHRRDFLRLTAHTSSLVLAGQLPLLAANRQARRTSRQTRRPARQRPSSSRNIFTEPPAIEPLTGYLGRFQPVASGSMQGSFTAEYELVRWGAINNQTGRPRNSMAGSLRIVRKLRGQKVVYESFELRTGQTNNRVTATLNCQSKLDAVVKWKVISDVIKVRETQAQPRLRFEEQGFVREGTIIRKNKLSTLESVSSRVLVPQEALLALLVNGIVKYKDLHFDMLQNGLVIKPNQTLHYSGQIQIPLAGETINLDCYAQTGYGILPTHFLVDQQERVQLITQENTNWALKKLS